MSETEIAEMDIGEVDPEVFFGDTMFDLARMCRRHGLDFDALCAEAKTRIKAQGVDPGDGDAESGKSFVNGLLLLAGCKYEMIDGGQYLFARYPESNTGVFLVDCFDEETHAKLQAEAIAAGLGVERMHVLGRVSRYSLPGVGFSKIERPSF